MAIGPKAAASKLKALKRIGRVLYGDLPPAVQLIAMQDGFMTHSGSRGNNFADAYRVTTSDIRIGFFGGTHLEVGMPHEHRVYYGINNRLMTLFTQAVLPIKGNEHMSQGWSVVTGAGRGVAMHGPMKCLAEHRVQVSGCKSKCIGIPSGLTDEPVNESLDWPFSTRPQNNITLREEMIIAMASDGIVVYPGNKGTLGELFWTDLINYVSGRVQGNLPLRPVILVDLKDNPEIGRTFNGGSFFSPIKLQWDNAVRLHLSKSVADSVHFVDADSPRVEFDIMQILTGHLVETGRLSRME